MNLDFDNYFKRNSSIVLSWFFLSKYCFLMHYFHYNKLKEKGGGGEDAEKATLKLCEAWWQIETGIIGHSWKEWKCPLHSLTPASSAMCLEAYLPVSFPFRWPARSMEINSNRQTFKFISHPLSQEWVSNQEALMDVICVFKKPGEYWALCMLYLIETQEN